MTSETSPETTVPVDEVSRALFEKRAKIYPREVHGLFAALRAGTGFVLLGLFYVMPWVPWDARQAILFDLPARKFYIFGWTLWPQDFIYLTFLLMLAAFALFFFTALAGRLWCGYACPQTVWTELFLAIERFIEGSRSRQMKRDSAPMSLEKIRVKALKHSVWIVLSAVTGFTFVAYFSEARALLAALADLELGPWEAFWMAFYGFATYGNAGWLREQVCIYMCPYARFQSAMFDAETLIISYDEKRGEPRGSRQAGSDYRARGLGDCIDCTMCVQVCPTGIDIRKGLQYECIGCSACIDVCDDVMSRMNYPKGLIRYTTENALNGRQSRVVRPRIIVYAVILLTLVGLFAFSLSRRSLLDLDVIRDRNALYRETAGMIENVYTLKIINMDDDAHAFEVTIEGVPDIKLLVEADALTVPAGSVMDVPVRVRASEANLGARSTAIKFVIHTRDKAALCVEETARFLGPGV